MSKETLTKIREAEAEADRILAEAEARAEQMRAEADAAGKAFCEESERAICRELSETMEQVRVAVAEMTDRMLEEAKAEADAIADAARFNRKSAEKMVIRGLDAKCR